ncbi:MAG: glycosyltransferase family 39 protein [Vicinamibacterales bacterium]|nr:glycosyltransferase family 39 protein [Vicinamibacterales bacterium]
MPRSRLVLLVVLCGLTFFAGLGRPAVMDSDEAFYAEAAREMVSSGDWLTPHYNYEYRFEKPVLYYWLASLAYLVVGVGEGAARFPSALAGLVLVLTTFAAARRWYDDTTGLLAGAITATSFGYVAVARQALPDLALAALMTLATWAALEALVVPRPAAEDRSRRWWLLASVPRSVPLFCPRGPWASPCRQPSSAPSRCAVSGWAGQVS